MEILEGIIKDLDNANPDKRRSAAIGLGNFALEHTIISQELTDFLIYILKNDKSAEVRAAVIYALGYLKDPRAREPLICTLKNDKSAEVRAEALGMLELFERVFGKQKDSKLVDILIHALENDKSPKVRAATACALGGLGDKRAVDPLICALRKGKKWYGILDILASLGRLNDPKAKGILLYFFSRGYGISQSLLNSNVIKYKISKLETAGVWSFMVNLRKISNQKIVKNISKIEGNSYDKKFSNMMLAGSLLNNEEYFNILINQGKKALKDWICGEIGFSESYNELSFIESIIKFKKEKDDKNIPLLREIIKESKSIKNWMYGTKETRELIEKMQNLGFDTDLYIASGETILEQKAKGRIEVNNSWEESLENILEGLIKKQKYSIPDFSQKKLYSLIEKDYLKFRKGDKQSAQNIIDNLLNIIKCKKRRDLEELHDMLSGLKDFIKTGNKTGTKLIAKVWRRYIPEDLYDNSRLACCIFKPRGECNKEIPLFIIDPKTTILQIWNDVSEHPLGVATLYAGTSEGKRTIFLDTFEAGFSIYNTLGVDKTKQFILDSLIKFSKKSGAERMIIYNCGYGKPREFVDFVKKQYELQKIEFEAIDEDEVLIAHSLEKKNHYTDAFEWNIMKGKLRSYVVDLA